MSNSKIDKDSDYLELDILVYQSITIKELKEWLETKIEQGYTKANVKLEYEYYGDISSIKLLLKK